MNDFAQDNSIRYVLVEVVNENPFNSERINPLAKGSFLTGTDNVVIVDVRKLYYNLLSFLRYHFETVLGVEQLCEKE